MENLTERLKSASQPHPLPRTKLGVQPWINQDRTPKDFRKAFSQRKAIKLLRRDFEAYCGGKGHRIGTGDDKGIGLLFPSERSAGT